MAGKVAPLILLAAVMAAPPVSAAPGGKSVRVDEVQVGVWNRFVEGLFEAHKHITGASPHRSTSRTGGYHRRPDYYIESSWYDEKSGRLVSRLRWENSWPRKLHAVELFFYDDVGRLARDYGAYYLPGARNAPIQTLINFHHYEDGLHAYRQFDASGERIYEHCEGTWFDEAVAIHLDEPTVGTPALLLNSEAYHACFGFLPAEPGLHVDPAAAILGREAGAGTREDPETAARMRVAQFTLRLKLAPNRAENYLSRGKAHFELREFDKAISDLSRAIELDDGLDAAWFWRGMALGRKGDVAEGISDLTVYIERNPDDSLAYTKRGVRHIWAGDFARAERDLTRAVELDAKNAEALDDLGVVLARREDYRGAVDSFRKAIAVEPGYQKAHHNLALVLHITGRDGEALIAVDNALRIGRRARASALLKAAILDRLGRAGEAARLRAEAELLPGKNWSENLAVQ